MTPRSPSVHAPFVKKNHSRFNDHLLCEAQGLRVLRRAAAGLDIDVPEVLHVAHDSLTLPFIRAAPGTTAHWRKLGEGLASIHMLPQPRFGFEADNYIGLNPQRNGFDDSWGSFFIERRLQFQVGLIADRGLQQRFAARLRQSAPRLREFLDSAMSASLVHGDLWSGNVICGEEERVWLIDPAAYFGDAEVDVAMTEMFGGFPAAFYSAYRSRRPEPANWAVKKRIYNLYHYLNHLNLFGDGYLDGCEAGFAMLDQL